MGIVAIRAGTLLSEMAVEFLLEFLLHVPMAVETEGGEIHLYLEGLALPGRAMTNFTVSIREGLMLLRA